MSRDAKLTNELIHELAELVREFMLYAGFPDRLFFKGKRALAAYDDEILKRAGARQPKEPV